MAMALGASDAVVIAADAVGVEDRFAGFCQAPRCPAYGQNAHCPPHGMTPKRFRTVLSGFDHALVFKIDVPTQILLSEDRYEINGLIHEIAATVEASARAAGRRAMGLAAGSCKRVFCHGHRQCRVLAGGDCRHPQLSRPSMSGLGVDAARLTRAAGWQIEKIGRDTDAETIPMGMLMGMVLLK